MSTSTQHQTWEKLQRPSVHLTQKYHPCSLSRANSTNMACARRNNVRQKNAGDIQPTADCATSFTPSSCFLHPSVKSIGDKALCWKRHVLLHDHSSGTEPGPTQTGVKVSVAVEIADSAPPEGYPSPHAFSSGHIRSSILSQIGSPFRYCSSCMRSHQLHHVP